MTALVGLGEKIVSFFGNSTSDIPLLCQSEIQGEKGDRLRFQQNLRDSGYLTLKDGSAWSFKSEDLNQLQAWSPKDQVVIVLANQSETQKFKIVNLSSKERPFPSVKVSLHMSPILNQESHPPEVTKVDYLSKTVLLSNGKKFQVHFSADISKWRESDVIILGMKNGPEHTEYKKEEILLINPQLDQHVCAILLNP